MRVALGTSWTVSFSVCIFLLSLFNLFICANLELFLFLWWELLSQGPLNFSLSKTLEWLVLYCMEHANLWQPKQSLAGQQIKLTVLTLVPLIQKQREDLIP